MDEGLLAACGVAVRGAVEFVGSETDAEGV